MVVKCLKHGTRWFHLVKSGLDVNPIITHVLPIQNYLEGFELMKSGSCGKVILDWTTLHG